MRSTDLISSARDLIRQQEWHEGEDGVTFRNGDIHLELSFDNRDLNVGTSPSAITKGSLCEKNLFLRAAGERGVYLDFQGNVRQVELDSHFNYVEGRIAHGSMELLIKLVTRNSPEIKQLGWKTILSPIVYTSVKSVLKEIDGLDRPVEIDTSVGRIEQLIELATRRVLSGHIGGMVFDRYSWHEQLISLKCTSEEFVQKAKFGGIIDLIVDRGDFREVVDFKFVRENEVDSANYSDEETSAILMDGESDRWNHMFQVCMYAWMLGDAPRASLAYMDEEMCSIEQFCVGPQTKAQVESVLRSHGEKISKVRTHKTQPSGAPSPQRCLHCPYHMDCIELLKQSTSFVKSYPNERVPLLLPVKKIDKSNSQLFLEGLDGVEVKLTLIGVNKSQLEMAEQSIKRGSDLVAYSEAYCDRTEPRSYKVVFSQRPERWSQLH